MTMTFAPGGRVTEELDRLLDAGLQSLDLSEAEHQAVVERYSDVGKIMDEHWGRSPGENVVSPQGSFLLGTVVRPRGREAEVDIDTVVKKDVSTNSVSQEQLKNDVGEGLRKYSMAAAAHPRLSESDRCWTLQWADMHMDVLPAVPDIESLSGTGLCITDRALRNWQHSDPSGYAAWFRGQMSAEFLAHEAVLAKRLQVDEVPAWKVKTTLQRAVQALKRHRDLYFATRYAARPSSIIITTLAARSYQGGGDLYDVLRQVTAGLTDRIERVDGAWQVLNPVLETENFADYWATEPGLASAFFEWSEAAKRDFDDLGTGGGLHSTIERFGKAFGTGAGSAAARSLGEAIYGARSAGTLAVAAGTGGLAFTPGGSVAATAATRPVAPHRFAGGARP